MKSEVVGLDIVMTVNYSDEYLNICCFDRRISVRQIPVVLSIVWSYHLKYFLCYNVKLFELVIFPTISLSLSLSLSFSLSLSPTFSSCPLFLYPLSIYFSLSFSFFHYFEINHFQLLYGFDIHWISKMNSWQHSLRYLNESLHVLIITNLSARSILVLSTA